ncbi:MAG: S-adenosylmethionine:tRNA ribosyltransferase-isomerase [Bacteroidota bacterium]|nr:S-adenosylmethionine:tRNA ribosyltransferase-isomerase [Bacteroidota bacterium]MDP4252468.1 S-adenosylmethionine:tRNA ribosyltransferase-isomerase [Bacteroidota bacterium]
MDPKTLSISDFQYVLPPGRIAHYPLPDRDASKLLIYRGGERQAIREDIYRNIDRYLPDHSLLVFNNSKVVEARIVFQKASGGQIELFCLEPSPEYGGVGAALMRKGRVRWKCLIGGASKWKPGQVLTRGIGTDGSQMEESLHARWIGRLEGSFLIELYWSPPDLSFAEVLRRAGRIPLPPYIRRDVESSDNERYQTVYARQEGSVAAPTAGLHFTDTLMERLRQRDIQPVFVTLHVGAGTFMPVKADALGQHSMHAEFIDVDKGSLSTLLAHHQGPVIPVGTTSLRTIESLYWLGAKTVRDPDTPPENLVVHQWDAYEKEAGSIPVSQALTSLLSWMERQGCERLLTRTQLLIAPGYPWKLAGGLVTNFHQPGSTLLLLVAALIGDDWRQVYRHALDHGFRFLSYGDGCLLLPGPPGELRIMP